MRLGVPIAGYLLWSAASKIVFLNCNFCCRHFAPIFSKFAKQLTKPKFRFASVDCPEVSKACEKQKVEAYPTIIAFNFPDEKNSKVGE